MLRWILRLAVAIGLAAIAFVAIVLALWRPRLWRANAAALTHRASIDGLKRDVASLPPFRAQGSMARQVDLYTEKLLSQQLTALGWSVQLQDVPDDGSDTKLAKLNFGVVHNLVATRGLAASGPITVIGAHLDSVIRSPGADDDGSGIAVLLELARLLSPEAASHVELCFFNSEEIGLHGSKAFAKALKPEDASRIRVAIVMDMVGAYDSRPHSQSYPPPLSWLAPDTGDFLSVIALTDADDSVQALKHAREQASPELSMVLFEPPRAIAEKFPDIWRSDHAPFWEAGVPAIFLTDTGEFRTSRYHNATDTADALDYARMAALTDALVAMLDTYK